MAANHWVYDSHHLQANCQEPRSVGRSRRRNDGWHRRRDRRRHGPRSQSEPPGTAVAVAVGMTARAAVARGGNDRGTERRLAPKALAL